MQRPERCCHPNCSECPFDECMWDCDGAGANEIEQYARYQKAHYDGKGIAYDYNHSDSAKESRKKYEQSEKGIATRLKYRQSEKYNDAKRRWYEEHREERREYQRLYYQRKKAEKRAAELAAMNQ